MIFHIACRHFVEQLFSARNFRLFNRSEIQAIHSTLCFGNKENVLYSPLIECNRPVWRIIAYRSWNMKSFRKFRINTNLLCGIQVLYKTTLYTLFSRTICKHIILNCLVCSKCLIKGLGTLFCRKDCAVILSINLVIRNMLNNQITNNGIVDSYSGDAVINLDWVRAGTVVYKVLNGTCFVDFDITVKAITAVNTLIVSGLPTSTIVRHGRIAGWENGNISMPFYLNNTDIIANPCSAGRYAGCFSFSII